MIPPEYANIDALNWSRLKRIDTSPRDYIEQRPVTSAGFAMGSLVHVGWLEPEDLWERYAIYDGRRDPRTKAYQAVLEAAGDKTIIKSVEANVAQRCVDALNDHPEARALLDRCPRREEIATFRYRGRDCKALRDLVGPGVVVDLKTCANLGQFKRDIGRYLYHGQVEFYGLPDNPAELFLIAVSTTDYDVGVFRMTDHTRTQARLLIDRLFDRLEECERLSYWPGRFPAVEDYDLPEYMSEEPDISF